MRSFLLTTLVGLLLVNMAFSLNKQRDCKCRIQANSRIIGGRDAARMAYPWQISLMLKEKPQVPDNLRKLVPDSKKAQFHNCGGSIINEYWILTAGHCVGSFFGSIKPSDWEIGFGENDLAQIYNKKQYKPIAAIHKNPNYFDIFGIVNDIALIKLAEPLVFNDAVQPACLSFDAKNFYDGALKISGWGSTVPVYQDIKSRESTKVIVPRFLKEAEAYDYSQENTCDHKQNICVKNEKTRDTACKGDSGGPIHYTKNGKSSVVGVLSFGDIIQEGTKYKICAGKMAYTRLSSFKSWVESKIHQEYCS